MSTGAEIKVPFGNCISYYISADGYPDTIGPLLKELIEKAQDMDGEFLDNLELVFRRENEGMDGILDGRKQNQYVDFVYRIEEDGDIFYKRESESNWSEL